MDGKVIRTDRVYFCKLSDVVSISKCPKFLSLEGQETHLTEGRGAIRKQYFLVLGADFVTLWDSYKQMGDFGIEIQSPYMCE